MLYYNVTGASQGVGGRSPEQGRMFFFEKKNQKTFIRWGGDGKGAKEKSLFVSFSSEKEESCLGL
jgi:hypothetical protein